MRLNAFLQCDGGQVMASSTKCHIKPDGSIGACSATKGKCRYNTMHGTKSALKAMIDDVEAQSKQPVGSGSRSLKKGAGDAVANVNAARLAVTDPTAKYQPNDRMSRDELDAIPLDSIPQTAPVEYDVENPANRLNSGEINEYMAAIDFALGSDVRWETDGDEGSKAYGVEIAGSKMYRRGDWLIIDKNGIITKTPVELVREARAQLLADQATDWRASRDRENAKHRADSSDELLPKKSKSYLGFARLASLTRASCKSDVKQATTDDDTSKADIRVYLDDGEESAISWKSYVNDHTPSYAKGSNATETAVRLRLNVPEAHDRLVSNIERVEKEVAKYKGQLRDEPDDWRRQMRVNLAADYLADLREDLTLLREDPAAYENKKWAEAMNLGNGLKNAGETDGQFITRKLVGTGFKPDFSTAKLVGKTYNRSGSPKTQQASENTGENWSKAAGVSEQEAVSAMAEVGWHVTAGDADASRVNSVAKRVITRTVVDLNPSKDDWDPTVADNGIVYMGDSIAVKADKENGREIVGVRQVVKSYHGLDDLWENRLKDGITFVEGNRRSTSKAKNKVDVRSHEDVSGEPGFEDGHWLSLNFDVNSLRPKDAQQSTIGVRQTSAAYVGYDDLR